MRLSRLLIAAVVATVVAALGPTAEARGTVTVSAASSLAAAFPAIAKSFQKRYPGTTVRFNFAGSSTLVSQVKSGAPVDVLATASESTMASAVSSGLVGKPVVFAKNTMAIAMPSDNPARIRSLADLSRPGMLVGVCASTVPCGAASRTLFARNKVTVTPVTQELDVRNVLGKVMSGDLDAGIVYVTDVRSAGSRVTSVAIPSSLNVTTSYPIAAVRGAANAATAQQFADYVRNSTTAQGILRAYGFARP